MGAEEHVTTPVSAKVMSDKWPKSALTPAIVLINRQQGSNQAVFDSSSLMTT